MSLCSHIMTKIQFCLLDDFWSACVALVVFLIDSSDINIKG